MKTVKINLPMVEGTDKRILLAHDLLFDKYKKEHPELNEDELADDFYDDVVLKKFIGGKYANIVIEVDEDFNIISGHFK